MGLHALNLLGEYIGYALRLDGLMFLPLPRCTSRRTLLVRHSGPWDSVWYYYTRIIEC